MRRCRGAFNERECLGTFLDGKPPAQVSPSANRIVQYTTDVKHVAFADAAVLASGQTISDDEFLWPRSEIPRHPPHNFLRSLILHAEAERSAFRRRIALGQRCSDDSGRASTVTRWMASDSRAATDKLLTMSQGTFSRHLRNA
ncbi:hypothetical protein MRX96_043933 [Rhipicephalus microplus]